MGLCALTDSLTLSVTTTKIFKSIKRWTIILQEYMDLLLQLLKGFSLRASLLYVKAQAKVKAGYLQFALQETI